MSHACVGAVNDWVVVPDLTTTELTGAKKAWIEQLPSLSYRDR